jgi:flavodoxin
MKLNPFILTLSALSFVEAFSPSTLNKRFFPLRNAVFAKTISSRDLVLYAKVGIFFGTSTGNTETVADYIAAEFGDDAEGPIEIDGIVGSVADEFKKYDALIVGTPTWNTGADSERSGTGWDEIYYGEMQDLNIAGKKVGVFGLGDQVSYSENYADASGEVSAFI